MSSRMLNYLERFNHDSKLPVITGERCVHALMENASCHACVDICPNEAWLLDDEALGLNADTCDGCGLCVPVCSEGAIRLDGCSLILRQNEGELFAFGACEYAQVTSVEGVIPCIHALRLQDVLQLFNKSVRNFSIKTGDCCQCQRAERNDLVERVAQLNKVFREMGDEGITIKFYKTNEWHHLLNTEMDSPSGPKMGRRSFFRTLVNVGAERKIEIPDLYTLDDDDFVPLGTLLPHGNPVSILPFVPVIDAYRCDGCDACVRLCPHEAIKLDKVDASINYIIEPENCTGCSVCADVCESDAISIDNWDTRKVIHYPLSEKQCRACGNTYHHPSERQQDEHGMCRICSKHNHYKNLHQVLS